MATLKVKTNGRFYREIQYKDANDAVIDITSYTIDLDIKTRSGTLIENLSVGSGITLTTPAQGKFTVLVADLSAWPIGMLVADIVITDDSGNPEPSYTFNIEVLKGITSV